MDTRILVGLEDLKVAKDDEVLVTLGLGSCIGISLYDAKMKIAGLAHIMLPDSTKFKYCGNSAKFVDTGIRKLINDMEKKGAYKIRMIAKIAGGAEMFSSKDEQSSIRIGIENIEAAIKNLNMLNIPIVSKDVGENYGRSLEFYAENGNLIIKNTGFGIKII